MGSVLNRIRWEGVPAAVRKELKARARQDRAKKKREQKAQVAQ